MPHYTEPRQFVIHSVSIENYRGLKKAYLELGKVNVLVGVNGSGKSSILQAISLCGFELFRPLVKVFNLEHAPSIHDFHDGEDEIHFKMHFKTDGPRDVSQELDFGFEKRLGHISIFHELDTTYGGERLIELTAKEDTLLDVFLFYPVQRSVPNSDFDLQPLPEIGSPRLVGYAGAFVRATNFSAFFSWFRGQEDIENEMRLTKSPNFRNPHLEAVRRAVEQALNGYKNLRVQRSPRLAMVMLKGGDQTSLEQMSDGEKAVITLIGDIARRACILNPHLENPLESPGVVMIDEIEQHLHPQWQRKIVEKLPEVFPNIQFIFTSHSPIVCNSVGPDELLVIKDGEIKSATAYGWSTKDVLKEIFEIDERPPEISNKLKQLDAAIDDANLELAKELVSELSKNLPAQDPELLRANVLIPMLEIEAMDERS